MYYDVVAKLAKERGISIKALEEEAELGNGTISKWRFTKPNIGNLEKVAKVLEVSVVDIIKACEATGEAEA